MAICICKAMEHGHGDHCEREATEPDGLCKECNEKMPKEAQVRLEDEQKHPLHLK